MLAQQLLALANAYGDALGLAPSRVGRLAANGHHSVFLRLADGKTCRSDTLEAAAAWFRANWPADVPWPEGVPR